MLKHLAERISRQITRSMQSNNTNPTFPSLIIERLYYAEGRHHPDHPSHGSQAGLGCL